MIVHSIRFSFKEGVRDDDKAKALAAITRTSRLPSVSFSCVGQDLFAQASGYAHAYVVAIKDLDALDRYMNDPLHMEGDFVFAPLVAKLAIFDMSDDGDPDLGAEVMAMHERKVAANPDWAQLFGAIPDVRIGAQVGRGS